MNFELILHFDGGYLRPLKVEDIHEKYISGLNDPEVNRYSYQMGFRRFGFELRRGRSLSRKRGFSTSFCESRLPVAERY